MVLSFHSTATLFTSYYCIRSHCRSEGRRRHKSFSLHCMRPNCDVGIVYDDDLAMLDVLGDGSVSRSLYLKLAEVEPMTMR